MTEVTAINQNPTIKVEDIALQFCEKSKQISKFWKYFLFCEVGKHSFEYQ